MMQQNFYPASATFYPPPLQYTIYQVLSSHRGLTLHFNACLCVTKKVNLHKTLDLRWCAFSLKKDGRTFPAPVHVRCCRTNQLRKKRVCGKIYSACETNDDTFAAKNRLVLQRVAASLWFCSKRGIYWSAPLARKLWRNTKHHVDSGQFNERNQPKCDRFVHQRESPQRPQCRIHRSKPVQQRKRTPHDQLE